jgi:hypothetical protein
MIIYVFKKHENCLKTIKIVEFFLIIWGKLSELESEFLTSWSRTKMDRLRNTVLDTTDTARDVGIMVSNDLKPSEQCSKAANTVLP